MLHNSVGFIIRPPREHGEEAGWTAKLQGKGKKSEMIAMNDP